LVIEVGTAAVSSVRTALFVNVSDDEPVAAADPDAVAVVANVTVVEPVIAPARLSLFRWC